ncbi:MAG: amidohydrolase family protein [Hyphomicrobiaceae bacterium]
MGRYAGAIDCDLHPGVPEMKTLLPFMDDYWQDAFVSRGIDGLEMASYPPGAPITCRADWKPAEGKPAADSAIIARQSLDVIGTRFAILNPLTGGQVAVSEAMGAAVCRAVNDWVAKEFLDKDPRFRASIIVPPQSPELAVEEIERSAGDKRFVQVMIPAAVEMMLGRRYYWPLLAACEKRKLPLGLHAGSLHRYPTTSNGWSSHYIQDYVSHYMTFEDQLLSLIHEGAFVKFPGLKVVLIESGVSWLPGFIWRAIKTWRGVRGEVPYVTRSPADYVREHVRLTAQPFDAPDAAAVGRIIEMIGSNEMLLFATDYPHWQFEGDKAMPDGIPDSVVRKMLIDNPLATYPRLKESLS